MTTRTYEDFHKWVGEKPERLGIVSNLYKQFSVTAMTEAIFNVYAKGKSKDRFQSINSFLVEWEISTNFIKRIPILGIEGDGSNGSEIIFQFPERYYEMHDVFTIEETRQQCYVVAVPIRRSDAYTECVCRLIDNDYKERLANPEMLIGTDTRFLTNHMPELHEIGYVKYQSSN